MNDYSGWYFFGGVVVVIWIISGINNLVASYKSHKEEKKQLFDLNRDMQAKAVEYEQKEATLAQRESAVTYNENLFNRLFQERTKNYPVVAEIWANLVEITDTEREKRLRFKKSPAPKAADEVQAIKREKRALIKELVSWKYKSKNYEAVFPWLQEELESDIEDEVEAVVYYSVYTEEERGDPVTQFISPEDYRKLPISERNQLALDRYWQRGKKTKWMIGKMYERYVGYRYESDGWDVEYFGIQKRFDDLGRDIIATKNNTIHVVQCKNWSKFKTIYENHIFQLFGTAYGLGKDHPDEKVVPVFFCSTKLSETANVFADRLGIQVIQNHSFKEYPAIKCNISAKGEKIYHLPFDQQYDNVKIEPKRGEFYAADIQSAESKGFRRAYKWRGIQSA